MDFIHLLPSKLFRNTRTSPTISRDLVLGAAKWNAKIAVILPERLRTLHLGILGLSGTGKTYFLENLIRQDIDRKTGFVVFDVHGDLADNVFAYIAQRAAANPDLVSRVVLIEPFDPDFSIGFNPLERSADTSPFLQAQELAHILRSRWQTKSFGPRTEELLRNSLYVLSSHNLTLLELPHLLANKPYRQHLLRTITEQGIADFWQGRYEPLTEAMKAVIREPLLTRISAFLADPHIRHILGQRKSTFTFPAAIRSGHFVIANLSKGKLGDENSPVLGSLLFTKLQLDVFAQARLPEKERTLFAVYADELQNFVGSNFATLVAEARKYRIALAAGHQSSRQLTGEMRNAMLGVGSKVFFRLNADDARHVAGDLPGVSPNRLLALEQGEAMFRSTSHNPIAFRVLRHPPAWPTSQALSQLRDASHVLYAASRQVIQREIDNRYQDQAKLHVDEHLLRGSSPPAYGPSAPNFIPPDPQ